MDPAPPDLQEQGAALYEETEATRAVLQEEQHALMRQIRTSAGSEQFVKAVIQHAFVQELRLGPATKLSSSSINVLGPMLCRRIVTTCGDFTPS
jgi:hypothetical protein